MKKEIIEKLDLKLYFEFDGDQVYEDSFKNVFLHHIGTDLITIKKDLDRLNKKYITVTEAFLIGQEKEILYLLLNT